MIIKLKWILILLTFPCIGYANNQCNSSSWNDNLTQFNQLESNYNQYVNVFNALLAEHKQRPLLSQTFSIQELALLWRKKVNTTQFENQLQASKQYQKELTQKAVELTKLSTQSKWVENSWGKLAKSCKASNAKANQISAEWYQDNANQLANDYKQLASQFRALSQAYDNEANALESSLHLSNSMQANSQGKLSNP
ncbi:ATPase [Vibrio mytili]|uniref:ATPase n=1 Tax=Vibrio mytili TaxID=50718 RepID=UPI002F3FCB17